MASKRGLLIMSAQLQVTFHEWHLPDNDHTEDLAQEACTAMLYE